MRVVSVVGFSESGKTRLVVRLIEALRGRGLKVAAVKRCSHGFALDTEGKDSAEFGRAGADGVVLISPEGWAALGPPRDMDAPRLVRRLFPDADVVLIEGGKDVGGTPKIEVRRGGHLGLPTTLSDDLVAIVSEVPAPGAAVPVFGPEETARIADLILAQKEADMAEIRLEIDGQEINMNAFVQSFIERTVVGMMTALTGVDPEPRTIKLEIDRTGAKAPAGPKP